MSEEVRGNLTEVCFLSPSCGSWGSLRSQAWQQEQYLLSNLSSPRLCFMCSPFSCDLPRQAFVLFLSLRYVFLLILQSGQKVVGHPQNIYAPTAPMDKSFQAVQYFSTQDLQLSMIPNDRFPPTACVAWPGTENAS